MGLRKKVFTEKHTQTCSLLVWEISSWRDQIWNHGFKNCKKSQFEKSGIDDFVGRRKNGLKKAALPP